MPVVVGPRMRLLIAAILFLNGVASAQDLTGIWRCDDGGVYRITQIGPHVWWYGRSADSGKTWQNVFHGALIAADQVTGNWADLPPGAYRNNGILNLRLRGGRLVAESQTGGFAGNLWTRGADSEDTRAVSPVDVQRGIAVMTPSEGGRAPSSDTPRLPEVWASEYTQLLESVIRRLSGLDGWQRYLNLEVNQLKVTSNSERVAKRLQFIGLLLRNN